MRPFRMIGQIILDFAPHLIDEIKGSIQCTPCSDDRNEQNVDLEEEINHVAKVFNVVCVHLPITALASVSSVLRFKA